MPDEAMWRLAMRLHPHKVLYDRRGLWYLGNWVSMPAGDYPLQEPPSWVVDRAIRPPL